MIRSNSFLPLPLFLAASLGVGLVFRYPLVTDDPYITYRYAQNLVEGVGFVFNAGERVQSTTTPLYTLILALLGALYPAIPAFGYWLSVISFGVAAWILWLTAGSVNLKIGGVLAGAFFLTAPALVMTFGLETGFYLMLGIAALYAYLRARPTLAFALAALLTLTRSDGVLVALLLGAHWLWSHRAILRARPKTWAEWHWLGPLLVYALILLPWFLFAWVYFGTPLPFTLAAKIAQGQTGLWDPFGAGLLKWFRENWLWLAPLAAFALVALVRLIRARSLLLLFGAWALLHLLGYVVLRVAFYPWYVAPLFPALALYAGLGIEIAVRRVWRAGDTTRPLRPFAALAAVALGLVVVGLELRADVNAGMLKPSPKVEAYERAAEWLAHNTPPSASVDALEVGVIGYYDQRRTVDFVGLVDPARIPYLRTRQFADGVRRAAAEYVVAIPPDTWLPDNVWFKDAYKPVQEIRVPGFYGNQPLVIYARADVGSAPVKTIPIRAAFEKQILLEQVELFAETVPAGARLPLRLTLRALDTRAVPESWKFTLQLVGDGNRVIAQTDNFYPARLPEDGKPFADYQAIPVPPDAPPGGYDLILAMYDVAANERLSFYDADGRESGDFLNLGKIAVTRAP